MISPSFAIIVPTKDSSALLPGLVRSLMLQTARSWRVIFVDASSLPGEQQYLDNLVRSDSRFSLVKQVSTDTGIYGAMNIGFNLVNEAEWALFWGSDDWVATPDSLQLLLNNLVEQQCDLLVCRGRYMRSKPDGAFTIDRATSFRWFFSYRLSLLLGSTPPHQCTLIGPGARRLLPQYNDKYRIAADLDYFLTLARYSSCRVRKSKVLLVSIAVGGISGLQHRLRFHEVSAASRNALSAFWMIPFQLRYLQRLATLIGLP